MKDWIGSVLIVHSDIHVARALASSIVEGHEVSVYIGGTGERARKFLRSTGVDLVIAGQKLPDMTGMELFSQLSRSDPWVRRVLLLSGEEEVNGDDAVRQGLIHHYMLEPIETPAFLHIVKENLLERNVASGPETEARGFDGSPVYPLNGRAAVGLEERPGSIREWEETSSRAVHAAPVEHPLEGLCPESSSTDQGLSRGPGAPSDNVASAHDQRHAEPERAGEEEIAPEILLDEYPEEEAPAGLLEEQEELFREAEAVSEQRSLDHPERRDADEGVHAEGAGGWAEAAPSAVLESETLTMKPAAGPGPESRYEPGADRIEEYADSTGESDELVSEAASTIFEEQPEEEEMAPAVVHDEYPEEETVVELLKEQEALVPEPEVVLQHEALGYPEHTGGDETEHGMEAEPSAIAEISCRHGATDQASERYRELLRLQRLNTVLDLNLRKREHELSDLNEEMERLRKHLESTRKKFEIDLRECRQNCVILKRGKKIQEERCSELERQNAEFLQRLAWVQEEWKRLLGSHEPENNP